MPQARAALHDGFPHALSRLCLIRTGIPAEWVWKVMRRIRALKADRGAAAREAQHYSWDRCTERFLSGLALQMEPLLEAA